MLATELVHEDSNGVIPQISKMGIVQTTGNYKLFKLDHRNRPIDTKHLIRLHDAVEKKNLLREYPILVDRNMQVIDGQHRLKVAESLSIPIYYIISDRVTIEDVAATNSNTLRWTSHQYLHHWCATGNLEYLKLQRFCEKHPFVKLSAAIDLCSYGNDRRSDSGMFAMGRYRANDIAFAEKVAAACLDFAEYVPFYSDRAFVATMAHLMANADYSHAQMMGKMKYLSTKLAKCPSTDEYMAVFTEIYNYKVPVSKHVVLRKLTGNNPKYRADRKTNKKTEQPEAANR